MVYINLYIKINLTDSPRDKKKPSESKQLYVPEYEDEDNASFVVDSWYKKSLWLYLLTPFSLLFTYLTNRRRRKFIKNKSLSYKSRCSSYYCWQYNNRWYWKNSISSLHSTRIK